MTPEKDALEAVRRKDRKRGDQIRTAPNDAICDSLAARRQARSREFCIEPRAMGPRPGLNLHDIGSLIEAGEGEDGR